MNYTNLGANIPCEDRNLLAGSGGGGETGIGTGTVGLNLAITARLREILPKAIDDCEAEGMWQKVEDMNL